MNRPANAWREAMSYNSARLSHRCESDRATGEGPTFTADALVWSQPEEPERATGFYCRECAGKHPAVNGPTLAEVLGEADDIARTTKSRMDAVDTLTARSARRRHLETGIVTRTHAGSAAWRGWWRRSAMGPTGNGERQGVWTLDALLSQWLASHGYLVGLGRTAHQAPMAPSEEDAAIASAFVRLGHVSEGTMLAPARAVALVTRLLDSERIADLLAGTFERWVLDDIERWPDDARALFARLLASEEAIIERPTTSE